eukprot:10149143-Alexandrium_andersonii.AAC.1
MFVDPGLPAERAVWPVGRPGAVAPSGWVVGTMRLDSRTVVPTYGVSSGPSSARPSAFQRQAVSYTHLTLPTICSV